LRACPQALCPPASLHIIPCPLCPEPPAEQSSCCSLRVVPTAVPHGHLPTGDSGLNEREIIVYKNCTYNCTFVYPSEVPPEAPRAKYFKTNSYYFVRCCNTINCNEGGPLSLDNDIILQKPIEEPLSGIVHWGEYRFYLTVASILVSNTLT
uniref:Glycosyl-phosphatidylinositol-anchored molecule-like protein n=1 Tax=Canis lupus familiaris TaxID=9615 RepID=A0A8I3NIA7_CANLF